MGWRHAHYDEVLERKPPLAFLEVHSENFFADGGAPLALLAQAREMYPLSLQWVGLSLGSAAGLDPWHLDQLARLVQRMEPVHHCLRWLDAIAPADVGEIHLAGHCHVKEASGEIVMDDHGSRVCVPRCGRFTNMLSPVLDRCRPWLNGTPMSPPWTCCWRRCGRCLL